MSTSPRPAFPWRRAWIACGVAFALRVVAGFALNVTPKGPRGFDFYGYIADNVVRFGEFKWIFYEGLGWKWANRGPVYPLFLALMRDVGGIPATGLTIVVQAAVGAIACLVPAWFALRWGGISAAVLAVWFAALWPYSVVNDTSMVEQVVYAPATLLAAIAALRAADRGTAAASFVCGVACGFATLVRLTFAVTIPFVAAFVLARRGFRAAALVALGAALALTPWVARNAAVTGRAVLGTDGGRALWLSNAPDTFVHYPDRSIDETERHLFATMPHAEHQYINDLGADECVQEDYFRKLASENIRARPAEVAWGGLRKAAAQWSVVHNPGPAPVEKYVLHGVPLLLLLAASFAAVALVPACRADLPVIAGIALSFTAIAMVFWGQPRYLAPLHGFGFALAAAWIARRGESAAERSP